jgi:hypothetical protein
MAPFGRIERRLRPLLQHGPDIGFGDQHVFETGRQHADNRMRLAVETDGPTEDHLGAAEATLCARVADEDRLRAADGLVVGLEIAPGLGFDAQNAAVVGRYPIAAQALGLSRTNDAGRQRSATASASKTRLRAASSRCVPQVVS